MRSLRARLLTLLLVAAASGLLALAAVTYTEQRSFLQARIDQEARAAGPAVSHALDEAGLRPPASQAGGAGEDDDDDHGPPGIGADGRPGAGGGPNLNLPPGTYGQRREADGRVLGGHSFFGYGQREPAVPRIPAKVALERLLTVGSYGSSGLQYRIYATRDFDDGGITVVAIPMREMQQTLSHLLLVEGLVIAGVLALLAVAASFAVRLGLRPLDRIGRTASEIAAGELSRRVEPEDSRTEVGRLGIALNAMLDRLEQAFAARESSERRLRRFLADASHELRTPLASIRGYAELFRMGATADPEELAEAMRRIEEEAARMGVLVEDLLVLARLDEAPEQRHEAVELSSLAADAVADARARAPEREIALGDGGEVWVVGDGDRLRQVLANLLGNALAHTPAGSPIEVSVVAGERQVEVAVRDHGPGLPEGGGDEIFERFWRAERGRERGRAGAGLGLAITRAIVEAHGGSIGAEQAPGGGALFRVRLPLERAPRAAEPVQG